MLTTATLLDRIRQYAVQSGSGASHEDKIIIATCLNPAARRVAASVLAASRSETVAVTGGNQYADIPSTLQPFVRSSAVLYGAARRPLTYVSNEEIARLTGTGEPEYWTLFNNRIRVGPTPASAGTIYLDAYGGPAPCAEQTPAATTDELGFPADAEDAVCLAAASTYCVMLGESTRASQYAELAAEALRTARLRLSPAGEDDFVLEDRSPVPGYFLHF